MNQNAEAIVILCSHLCVSEGVKPLEPREWSKLAKWLLEHRMEPRELLEFGLDDFCGRLNCTPDQAERMSRLIGRSASLSFEVSRYESMGIRMVTRAEEDYPRRLKQKLGNTCPPIFYYAGDLSLLDAPCVGYTGSRSIGVEDLDFTRQTVQKTARRGFSVVSGGAKGVDTAAETEVLLQGGRAVVYLADSLMRRIKKRETLRAIQDGQLILLSSVKPDAGFRAGVAMARNRLIYCQSNGTVVVRSDLEQGGTWSGASECLKRQWAPVFCWNNPEYPGNAGLIAKGAVPVDQSWSGDVLAPPENSGAPEVPAPQPEATGEQISLFDS